MAYTPIYVSVAEVKTFVSDKLQKAAYGSPVDDAKILEDVERVEAKMRAYIVGVYSGTITEATDLAILKDIALTLVLVKTYSRIDNARIPESVVLDKEGAMKELKNICNGVIQLDSARDFSSCKPSTMKIKSRAHSFKDKRIY